MTGFSLFLFFFFFSFFFFFYFSHKFGLTQFGEENRLFVKNSSCCHTIYYRSLKTQITRFKFQTFGYLVHSVHCRPNPGPEFARSILF